MSLEELVLLLRANRLQPDAHDPSDLKWQREHIDIEAGEQRGTTTQMLRPAWHHAKPSHQQAALTVLRLGRKGPKRKPMPSAETERRRLVDYLAEERSDLGSDQG